MGEKIKDIHPIRLGKMSCMVELNEGYSSNQGRMIHIQNDKFRYLLDERDFYHFALATLFSWNEFKYVKEHFCQESTDKIISDKNGFGNDCQIELRDVENILSSIPFEYRILKIEWNVLSVIVNSENLKAFKELLEQNGAKKVPHPFGKEHGFVFLYQMNPFLMYEIMGCQIEVYCQLPCASTTPKTWMPLHKCIQMEVWKGYEDEDGLKWCNANCQYIYILSRAILLDRKINPDTIDKLDKLWSQLEIKKMHDLLSVVYFKFTDLLFSLLQLRAFDKIVPAYYSFLDY